jgi:hypothetical protein
MIIIGIIIEEKEAFLLTCFNEQTIWGVLKDKTNYSSNNISFRNIIFVPMAAVVAIFVSLVTNYGVFSLSH